MKVKKILFISSLLFLTVLLGASFAAQNDDRYVRLRYVTGDVTILPADGTRSSDATPNSPILDGDEIQTANGRAELSFRNGVVVRIGDDSDVLIHSTYSPVSIDLRNGTVFVDSGQVNSLRDELEVTSEDVQVYMINEGTLRIDHGQQGSVRVTSIAGEAEIRAAGNRVLLEAGERTYVDPGNAPERPEMFSGNYDDLDDWNDSRSRLYADRGGDEHYVDESVAYDSSDLYGYGDWQTYGNNGYVWVPHVDSGWRPYVDGYWSFANGGWFWVSYEPWGWAPYHYGSWGWANQFGWYWIPGAVFAPSWVSWYTYGDYIGWCPYNYWNHYDGYYGHDHGYYGTTVQKQKTSVDAGNAWTFIKKDQIGASNIQKVTLGVDEVKKIQINEKSIHTKPESQMVDYVLPKPGSNNVNRNVFTNSHGLNTTKDRQNQFTTGKNGSTPAKQNWEQEHHTAVTSGDVKSHQTVGKGKDNQFDHGNTNHGNSGWTPPGKTPPGAGTVQHKQNESNSDIKPPKTQSWKDYSNDDRDAQFEHHGLENRNVWNPDYKNYDYGKPSDRDYGNSGGYDGTDNSGNITPRYSDDVKKMFQQHDWSNDSGKNNSGGSGGSDRKLDWKGSQGGSPKSSPPPQSHGGGNNNNSNHSSPPPAQHRNNNQSAPPPPHKH